MITIKIEDKEFKIKSSWKEVSFAEFVDYIAITQDTYSEVMKFIKIITSFSVDCDKAEFESLLLRLSLNDFKQLQQAFSWITNDITNISTKKKTHFEIDGNKYKIKENYEQLTVGEMVTLETLLKDKSIDASHLELAFAVLFRKLDDNGKEIDFNIEDFLFILKNMKYKVLAIDVIQHVNFFLSGEKDFTQKTLKASSNLQILKTNIKECQKKKLKSTKKKKNV